MENLEANSESIQPETMNTNENETSPDPATPETKKPGRPTRNPIEELKRLWDWLFNNR